MIASQAFEVGLPLKKMVKMSGIYVYCVSNWQGTAF